SHRPRERQARTFGVPHLCGANEASMILLFNPRSTKPRNRRFPLSILALAAGLEGKEEYEIIDGNVDDHATETILHLIEQHDVELLAVTAMPGPQMAAAIIASRAIRR